MKYFIPYYRVSTKGQGDSGLGLESQKATVERYIVAEQQKAPACLFAEFTDIESGKNSNRQGLNAAIISARNLNAKGKEVVLLIAKLDRLSRNLTFISALMDSGVKFIACDMPEANNFTIHIFAALAQQEVGMISQRTIESLNAFKKRNPDGFIDSKGKFRKGLGNPENLTKEAGLKGALGNRKKSLDNENNIRAKNYSKMLRASGMTLIQIADKLNKDGFRTSTGCNFMPTQVKNLLDSLKSSL